MQILHDDLLWYIFAINADMTEDPYDSRSHPLSQWKPRAITNTRNASHVCRSWRQLILSSSSLWGRLVDLKYIGLLSEEWRQEVIHRNGDAPLSIKGEVYSDEASSFRFFADLINNQWSRIESLKVHLCIPGHSDILSPIYKPSKLLKSFELAVSLVDTSTLLPKGDFFDNEAPKLSFFACSFGLQRYFNASWFTQLRHLEVRSPYDESLDPSLPQWLDKLRDMQQLEWLSISGGIWFQEESYRKWACLPIVRLPFLNQITVHNTLFPALLLLDRLDLPPKCGMELTTPDDEAPTAPFEVSLVRRVLIRHAERWIKHARHQTHLSFSIMYKAFLVSMHSSTYAGRSSSAPFFHIDIYCASCAELPLILPYLEVFSGCDFSHITTFWLNTTLFEGMELEPPVERFLYSFPNVKALHTSMEAIERLLNLPGIADSPRPETIFPKMRKVILKDEQVLDAGRTLDRGAKVGRVFFQWRESEGCPVEVLEVIECRKPKAMSYLEEFKGMKVIWMDKDGTLREYICGSGGWAAFDTMQGEVKPEATEVGEP